MLPPCDEVAPWNPVREAFRAHVAFAHDEELRLDDALPFEVVVVFACEHERLEHVVPDVDVALLPRGPVLVPVWEVSKAEAAPVMSASERRNAVADFIRR